MKKRLPLLLGCLFAGLVQAQDLPEANSSGQSDSRKPAVVLKLAPLTLLELQNTVEMGVEVRMHDRMSIQGQFGYAPDWLIWRSSEQTRQYTDRENWRGRLETRWYVSRSNSPVQPRKGGTFPLGRYIAIDALYKQLNALNTLTIGHQCTFGCAYYEKAVQPITRYIGGLGVKFGAQTVIGRRRATDVPSWLFDLYVGFGVRKGWTEQAAIQPGDQRFSSGGGFLSIDPFQTSTNLHPNLLMGIKVGFVR